MSHDQDEAGGIEKDKCQGKEEVTTGSSGWEKRNRN